MSNYIEIIHNHRLQVAHCYSQPLRLGNLWMHSFVQGLGYIKLWHHGEIAAATQLLADAKAKWCPDTIGQTVEKILQTPNVNFDLKVREILHALVVHQIKFANNPFRMALEAELQAVADPITAEFRVFSRSEEMVLSSGNRPDKWKSPTPGANVWAELLDEMRHKTLLGELIEDDAIFPELFTNALLFNPIVKKTALIVMDSQGRLIKRIKNGHIVPIGGGRYEHAITVLRGGQFNLADFKWIIVYMGTNCSVRKDYSWNQRNNEWMHLKRVLVDEASRRDSPSVLFCAALITPASLRTMRTWNS